MATLINGQLINLDYFSICPDESRTNTCTNRHRGNNTLSALKIDGLQSMSNNQFLDNPFRTSPSLSSSPSSSLSSSANFWETLSESDRFAEDLFSAESPHSPGYEQLTSPSAELVESNCSSTLVKGLSSSTTAQCPLAFDDFVRWDESNLTPDFETVFPKSEPLSPVISLGRIPTNHASSPFDDMDDVLFENIQDGACDSADSSEQIPLQRPTRINLHESSSNTNTSRFNTVHRAHMKPLTQAEALHLRSIAMPQLCHTVTSSRAISEASLSPEPQETRKRKLSTCSDSSFSSEDSSQHKKHETCQNKQREVRAKQLPPKKTAHNMIEKRYRTNLNDKITALRDSVPSLRVVANEEEDLQGLSPAHKLNKATILSKATEYIAHLEKRTKNLEREARQLQKRVCAFEMLFEKVAQSDSRVSSRRTRRQEDVGNLEYSNGEE